MPTSSAEREIADQLWREISLRPLWFQPPPVPADGNAVSSAITETTAIETTLRVAEFGRLCGDLHMLDRSARVPAVDAVREVCEAFARRWRSCVLDPAVFTAEGLGRPAEPASLRPDSSLRLPGLS